MSSESETDTESDVTGSDTDEHSDTNENEDGIPLQLISLERSHDFEETLQLTLRNEVLDRVLETCQDKPICIIAVTGHARSGKSFLLNCIKERLKASEDDDDDKWLSGKNVISGFEWKHGYKHTTQGIWIWSRAFIVDVDGKDVAVLLLDTQGFNDETTKQDEISAILGVSLLFSSVAVINLVSDLSEDSLDWLSPFIKYGSLCSTKEIADPFQNISFLVRDWTRLSEYTFGEKSGDKFLKKVLKIHKEGSKCSKVWEVMDCVLLPNIGSKALLKSFVGNTADLNKEFAKRLQSYIKDLTSSENLPIKKILGNDVNSQDFKQFLQAFVEMFNSKCKQDPVLKAELIWAATTDAAEKLKLDRGKEAYQQFYRKVLQHSMAEYLKDTAIEGMHVQARDVAVEAFRYFNLPNDEEDSAVQKLDQLLEKEKAHLKRENEGGRRTQVTEGVGRACESMRCELASMFPFTPPPGTNVPVHMVFYENEQLLETIGHIRGEAKDAFLEPFQGEDEEGMQSLRETIDSVLEPIAEEYIAKNAGNRKRAETSAATAISELKEEYVCNMRVKIDKLKSMNAETLALFHEMELKTIEQKFSAMHLGTASYQAKWKADLLEEISDEHETMEMSLESKMEEAMDMITERVESYKTMLQEKCEECESEEEISAFHDEHFEAVVRKFIVDSPFKQDTPRGELAIKKLNNLLQTAYSQVVEDGVIRRRKMQEQLQAELEASYNFHKNAIETLINDNEFLEAEEFENKSKYQRGEALALFTTKTNSIALETETIEIARNTLSNKLNQCERECKHDNEQRRNAATIQADTICATALDKYKLKLMEAASKLSTLEELMAEHTKWKEQTLKYFEDNCQSKQESLLNCYQVKISESVEKEFAAVKEFFDQMKQTENMSLMTALFQATTEYVENMNTNFRNKNGYFSEQELTENHKKAVKTALGKVQADPPITKEQKKKLEQKLEETFQRFKDKNDLVFRSFENQEPAIGIDLGTTYCCMAIYINGKVKIIPTTSGNIVPSYVRINADDTKLFGQPAKDQAYESPESTIFDAKRIIGRRMVDKALQSDMKYWPFTVVEDDEGPKIEVNGTNYYPEQISGLLLQHLKEEAEAHLNFDIKKAVITVPAYFTDAQREATVRAGKLAGLDVLAILNEPTAAAVAYRLDCCYDDKKRNILVFDLGGGTFDVAVLEISKDDINVLSVNGDDHLGGEDFDKNMMKYCAEQFQQKTGIDLFKDKDSAVKLEKDEARRRLRRLQTRCEAGKKTLTTAPSVVISIDAFAGNNDLVVEVRRSKFEEINDAYFRKTITIVDDTLRSANRTKKQIDEVVLVGGSTRIPKLQRMLQSHFNGKALSKDVDPDQAVAYGAAVQAAIKCAKPGVKLFDFEMIQEVTPMSLGIEMANHAFDVIIPKNTKIPTTLEQEYETHKDGQTSAWIRIFQGEKEKARDNKLLGDFTLEGIPPDIAGKERVKVSMHINANGILNVEGICKSTKGSNKMTVSQEKGIMSEQTMKRLISEARPAA